MVVESDYSILIYHVAFLFIDSLFVHQFMKYCSIQILERAWSGDHPSISYYTRGKVKIRDLIDPGSDSQGSIKWRSICACVCRVLSLDYINLSFKEKKI